MALGVLDFGFRILDFLNFVCTWASWRLRGLKEDVEVVGHGPAMGTKVPTFPQKGNDSETSAEKRGSLQAKRE